jgi:hypothetical protein
VSIVKSYPQEYPQEGQVVYADNGKFSPDRAIFKNGQFIGGGEFPVAPYSMSFVSKWFCLDEYKENMTLIGEGKCYGIGFSAAEEMPYK